MRRRSSVIAPLILILIGGVFLLRNFFPEVHVGDLIAAYWPWILIVWGVIRLAEVVGWTVQSKPLPRNGITGGEWVLVVFLCIFGSAFHAVHNRDFFPDFFPDLGQRFDYKPDPVEQTCGSSPRVIVENKYGYVHIKGADVSKVTVVASKYVRSFAKSDADRANGSTPVELIASGNDVTIRTNQERVHDRIATDLEITVPRGASIQVPYLLGTRSITSDVTIESVAGPVDVTNSHGAVSVRDIAGAVTIDSTDDPDINIGTVKGAVVLKGDATHLTLRNIGGDVTANNFSGQFVGRALAGALHLQGSNVEKLDVAQVPGEIKYEDGRLDGSNLVGPVAIRARSTDMQLIGFTKSLSAVFVGGNEKILVSPDGTAMPEITLNAESADINLTLPDRAAFDLRANTLSGRANNDYGPPLRIEDDGGKRSVVGGQSGAPEVHVTTDRGDITIAKQTPRQAL